MWSKSLMYVFPVLVYLRFNPLDSALILSEFFSPHPIKKKDGLFSPLVFLCLSILDPSFPLWLFKELSIIFTFTQTHTHTNRYPALETAPGGENKADKVNRTCGEREGLVGWARDEIEVSKWYSVFYLQYDVDSDWKKWDAALGTQLWERATCRAPPRAVELLPRFH